MREQIENLLHKIYVACNAQKFHSPALMSGTAGKILFDFSYNNYFGKELDEAFASNVQSIAAHLDVLNGAGLCNGRCGTDWLFYYLYQQEIIEKDDLDFFCSDPNQLAQYSLQLSNKGDFDYLHGAVGIAHYLLNNDFFTDEIFFKELLLTIQQNIEANHFFKALPEYDFVKNEVHSNAVNLGMAHGIASVLKLCIECYVRQRSVDDAKHIAYTLIDFYTTHTNKTETGSFYSNRIIIDDKEQKSRLAWCYGDLMIGKALLDASFAFNDAALKNFALKILHATTQRVNAQDTNVHDACFCHGSAGLAHIYKKIFLQTNDKVFDKASNFWMHKTIQFLNDESFNNNYNLIEGVSGTGLVLYSFLSNNFEWDFCFMLND